MTTSPSLPRSIAQRSLMRSVASVGAVLTAVLLVMPGTAAAQDLVQVGIPNTASDVGFFLADKNGYFSDEGIEVKFTTFPSAATMIAPLSAGQLDVGSGGIAAGFYNAVNSGVHIKIVADKASNTEEYENSTLMIRKDHVDSGRFKDLSDLKGMTLAAVAQGANSESQINIALTKGGLSYDDANVIFLAFPEMYTALANKAIDGAINNEPTISRMIRDGVAVPAGATPVFPGFQTSVMLYSENFAEQRRDVAERFMRAYLRAMRDYNDSLRDGGFNGPTAYDVINVLTEYTAIKDADIYRYMTPFASDPNGAIKIESLEADLEFFKSRGLVPADVELVPYIDTSFIEAAVESLGPYTPAE